MASRFTNRRHDITGMLLTDGQRFMQILEGPRTEVRALCKRIEADPRHRCVVELMRSDQAQERWYPSWSLGYLPVSALELDSMVSSAMQKLDTEPTAHWTRSAQVLKSMWSDEGMPAPTDAPTKNTEKIGRT